MARTLTVQIIGDASSLEKSYRSAERGTRQFGSSMEKAGRGAVTASVGFRGLGRAVGFASASFLGGAGLVTAITSTVKAAEEAQAVLGQTRNAVERSGLSWGDYGKRIQDASLATAKLSGFDDEKLLGTFSNLVRRTRDVNEALHLNALAADVARGRNISLESASQLVLKASIGQTGALRRLGINLGKHATSLQAIDVLTRRYSGSAAAYGRTAAGAQDRFRVALQNMQEAVGAGLLPIITEYLDKASDWLNNTKNQKRVTDDVKQAVGLLTGVVKTLKGALDDLNKITGSTKDTLKLLFGALVLFKTLKLASTLSTIAGNLGLIGANAGGATGKVAGLRGALVNLKGLGPIAIGVTVGLTAKWLSGTGLGKALKLDYSGMDLINDIKKGFKSGLGIEDGGPPLPATLTLADVAPAIQKGLLTPAAVKILKSRFATPEQFAAAVALAYQDTAAAAAAAAGLARGPHDLPTGQAAAPILGAGALTARQRNDLALAAAGRTKTPKDDLAALVARRVLDAKAIRVETARLKGATTASAAKSFADTLQSLLDDDASTFSRIQSLTDKGAKAAKDATTGGGGRRGKSPAELAAQRNTFFDDRIARMLDRVQDIPTLKGQIARLKEIAGIVQQRIKATGDVTRRLTLSDTLADINRRRRADEDEKTQNDIDAANTRKEHEKEAAAAEKAAEKAATQRASDRVAAINKAARLQVIEINALSGIAKNEQAVEAARQKRQHQAAITRRNAAQFRALGLTATGQEPTPGVDALARRLQNLKKELPPSLFKSIGDVLAEGINKVGQPVRAAIDGILDKYDQLGEKTKTSLSVFRHASAANIVASLGGDLSRAQRLRLETAIRGVGPGGSVPRGSSLAFAAGHATVINGGVHLHGVQDVPAFENELVKRSQARGHVRRGSR